MNHTPRLLAYIGVMLTCMSTPVLLAQNVKVDEQKAAGVEQSVLSSAKNLFAAASYEAALLELSAIDSKDDVDQVDTYRALCQLALDRPREAEQTLGRIVTREPLYAIDEAEYSPRLVSMFKDVRSRALPGVAQQSYVAARDEYQSGHYSSAVAKFKQLFAILADPALSDQSGKLSDLKELADGFLKLSEQKVAEAAKAAAPAALAAGDPSPRGRPAAPLSYTLLDAGVTPPVVVSQAMPVWKPPQQSQFLRNYTYDGRLELVIDEQGSVVTATLAKSIWPPYDWALLEAAKHWRYQPAVRDGKPVRFRKVLDITLSSGDSTARP